MSLHAVPFWEWRSNGVSVRAVVSLLESFERKQTHFEAFRDAIADKLSAERRKTIFGADNMKLYDYLWLRFIIETHSWSVQGQRFLVPLTDFFVHIPRTQPREIVLVDMEEGMDFLRYHKIQEEVGAFVYSSNHFSKGDFVGTNFGIFEATWLILVVHGVFNELRG